MLRGKKLFLPILLCLLSMLVVACGGDTTTTTPPGGNSGNSSDKAPADKQIYVSPYVALKDLKTLDPAKVEDLYSAGAVSLLFNGLVQLDTDGSILDVLAASHKVSDDGLTYTFTLRDNLKFSDGSPLTSADVVYSLDRALKPETKPSYAASFLAAIKDGEKMLDGSVKTLIGQSIQAPDPKTVVLTLGQPASYFLASITHQVAFIVQKSAIEKYGDQWTDHLGEMGGTGPFIVEKYERGKQISFVPNPNYFGKKPQLSKIVRPFYVDGDTAYRAYKAGQLDTSSVPSASQEEAKALPEKQYHKDPTFSNSYIAFNYLVKPFDNLKIRQAFSAAINRDLIANNIYKGSVIPSFHIVPEGMPGYNPDLVGPGGSKSTAGDPAVAKKLLEEGMAEAGYKSVADLPPIVITTSTGGGADSRNANAALQQMWKNALGIDVKIDEIDFNKMLDDINGTTGKDTLMAWFLGWIGDYPDPQNWLSLQFASGSSQNNMNYGQNTGSYAATQQQTQQLMATADTNLNQDERLKQYMDAEQQLVNDVAWMTIYQSSTEFVLKACVVGIKPNPNIIDPPDSWGDIYKTNNASCANTSQYQ